MRGLVVQVILENCSYPSMDIFREVLGLLTVLWTSFRRHLKVELTILFNDVLLRVLRSPHAPLEKKVEVLDQLINHWFAQPANLGTFRIKKMKFSNCVTVNRCNYCYCDFCYLIPLLISLIES